GASMQEGSEVGWDPISIHYSTPWPLRAFVIYVVIVFVVSLVKSLRLSLDLWLFPNRKLVLWKNSSGKQLPRFIAAAALTRNFREILKSDFRETNLWSHLRQGETEFLYRWQLCLFRAESVKKLAALTIIVSVWVSLTLAIQTLSYIGMQKIATLGMIGGSGAQN